MIPLSFVASFDFNQDWFKVFKSRNFLFWQRLTKKSQATKANNFHRLLDLENISMLRLYLDSSGSELHILIGSEAGNILIHI